ncbi:hypothetical protein IGI39_003336 [Enterococcus sp. AZ135]
MQRIIQKVQMRLLGKNKIKCPSCKKSFWMPREKMELAKKFNGPYCPRCAKRLKEEVLIDD